MTLRIGTRGSALARVQAADVARRLEAYGHETETVIISTAGDRTTDRAFADVGAFGIFVREIESALLEERIDVAVHSFKDLPSVSPKELVVAAVPERVDAADLLLARCDAVDSSAGLIQLRPKAHIGTSAARRQALLRTLRPDLEIGLLRGNVPTRIEALASGRFDAIILAAAGVGRLERANHSSVPVVPSTVVVHRLDPAVFVPAPAQGAIAVQVRRADRQTTQAVQQIDDPVAARTLQAERAALGLAEGGCTLPFGAWCEAFTDGTLTLHVVLGLEDGTLVRAKRHGSDPALLARETWHELSSAITVS
ncbi:MAG: hydroxymethylbilane synthase [Gemmatimonadaceae bacterium]